MTNRGTPDQIAERYIAICAERDELRAEVERLNQALDMVAEEREAWKAKTQELRAALEHVIDVFGSLARMGAGRAAIDDARNALGRL